jgi:WD40 repeat protein
MLAIHHRLLFCVMSLLLIIGCSRRGQTNSDLFEVDERHLVLSLSGEREGAISSLAFSSNSNCLVAGSHAGMLIWKVPSGALLNRHDSPDAIVALQIHPISHELFAGCFDGTVWCLTSDSLTVRPITRAFSQPGLAGMAINPAGSFIAFGRVATKGSALVFDLETKKTIRIFKGNDGTLSVLAFPTDASLLVGDWDGRIVLYDTVMGKQMASQHFPGALFIDAALSPDRRIVALLDNGNSMIRLIDSSTLHQLQAVPSSNGLKAIQFTPDGSKLVVAAGEAYDAPGTVICYDAKKLTENYRWIAHRGQTRCLAFSPNGRWLATSGSCCDVKVWDWEKQGNRD